MAVHGTSPNPSDDRSGPANDRNQQTTANAHGRPTVRSQNDDRRVPVRAWRVAAVLILIAAGIAGCGSGTTATSVIVVDVLLIGIVGFICKVDNGNVDFGQLPGRQGTDLPGPRRTQDVDHRIDRPRPPDRWYDRDQGLRRPGPNEFRCRQDGRESMTTTPR